MDNAKKILWVDDEIDLLKPHLKLLEQKGYAVDTATNGEDAVELVRGKGYDLVFLDEMMPGKGGLQTLAEIKDVTPGLPVVMVTKSETESLMEEAIGGKITDYLTKPVNPSQILLACKKIFDSKKITSEHVSRDYAKEFQNIALTLMNPLDAVEWIELYKKLTDWDIELDGHPELGLRQTLLDQKRECNAEFAKFVDRHYQKWIADPNRPVMLSTDIVERVLIPSLSERSSVFFFVIDCLRLDQWLIMEEVLSEYYSFEKQYHFSILPTATPYSRNAIFSGLFPAELERRFPEIWQAGEDDENSRNRHEHELLDKLLERKRIPLNPGSKYVKILDAEFGRQFENNILSYTQGRLTAVVVNFVDMLAHGRSDSPLLKEIAPDEAAYRSLTRSWFLHSSLFSMLKTLAKQPQVKIILTTDHGSVRCLRGSKVIGDREASTNLRYKFGRNLKVDEKQAVFVKNPAEYLLPRGSVTTNYVMAKEDYFFVYPTDYHRYLNQYRDSFQHGGISMEEMILPVVKFHRR
ncbi:MAG TPA: bifunctional response regulator/alkaline phosphatase family protein [Bacteroidota bacterium]|nr:bifunctional response regulator/alkaline phosphatase family protein [Bacteroidota bacterium]